ncbi:MAG: hypothetical protein IT331_24690 [Anaerolineae bacterium]|nr:hypothetical protein [Anaerolineae bacterium]
MERNSERDACTPTPLKEGGFNPKVELPYGLTARHVESAMKGYLDFLGFVNSELNRREIPRLEMTLMPANFSSIVGEFMTSSIPRFCPTLVKNRYHNGHPDLVPAEQFTKDAVQHSDQGIEVKASRYLRGWQGHNAEDIWLMVFVFDSNRPSDLAPRPFRFLQVLGGRLSKSDWIFSGRGEKSRRTITASVTKTGHLKMSANWIYRDSVTNPKRAG